MLPTRLLQQSRFVLKRAFSSFVGSSGSTGADSVLATDTVLVAPGSSGASSVLAAESALRVGNMGGSQSSQAGESEKRERLLQTEQSLLHSGLRWWRKVRHDLVRFLPEDASRRVTSVSYRLFDVAISPSEVENPVLHSEQEKYGKQLHIHTALYTHNDTTVGDNSYKGESASEEAKTESVADSTTTTPIVLLHGYGSGIGIYSASMAPLAATLQRPVYAIDGLGCGLSARPSWTLGYGSDSDLDHVEEYSADALELWRKEIGAEKIILCGHSIGGYLSVAYAERYPERVERLVLLSPAGVAGPPPEDSSRRPSALFRFARFLWNQNISPLSASKYVFGRYFIDRYVQRRFPDYEWFEKPTVADYLHGVWTFFEPSAGAHHHTTILLPGAYARRPLEDRITRLKVPRVAAIYGTNDWMNPTNFLRVIRSHAGSQGTAKEEYVEDIQFMQIDKAGHNLQIDNPLAFVAAMQAYLLRDEHCTGRIFRSAHFNPT